MRELNKNERQVIHAFVNTPIPDCVKEYSDENFDLMDCYEVGFVFAHDLLRNQKIDPRFSPWGDGNSVIFDRHYAELLQSLLKANLSPEMNEYCQAYLNLLELFKAHFTRQE